MRPRKRSEKKRKGYLCEDRIGSHPARHAPESHSAPSGTTPFQGACLVRANFPIINLFFLLVLKEDGGTGKEKEDEGTGREGEGGEKEK